MAMKLYYSTTSPFVRKVNIVAIELGLDEQIQRVSTNPWVADAALLADNPLSKIPTLITDDGVAIFDSPVICEYLASLDDRSTIIPVAGQQRWLALRSQALADGLLDAGILRFLEAKRTEDFRHDWDAMQKSVVERSLDQLEKNSASWNDEVDIGQISAGCALGWLDFRFAHEDWRIGRPALTAWYEKFSQRPSMQATVPHVAA